MTKPTAFLIAFTLNKALFLLALCAVALVLVWLAYLTQPTEEDMPEWRGVAQRLGMEVRQ